MYVYTAFSLYVPGFKEWKSMWLLVARDAVTTLTGLHGSWPEVTDLAKTSKKGVI